MDTNLDLNARHAAEFAALTNELKLVADDAQAALKLIGQGKPGSALGSAQTVAAHGARVSMLVARLFMLRELGAK